VLLLEKNKPDARKTTSNALSPSHWSKKKRRGSPITHKERGSKLFRCQCHLKKKQTFDHEGWIKTFYFSREAAPDNVSKSTTESWALAYAKDVLTLGEKRKGRK